MGTHTLSEALAGAFGYRPVRPIPARSGAPHPTGARVLRDSVEAGTFEHVFFASPAKGETDRLLRAARRLLDAGRQLRSEARKSGRTLTPTEHLLTTLTSASVRVFEEILTLSRLNRGRVFPSYEYLTEATSLGRATIARALTILERVGLLVRQRRFKRIEADGPGPRYEQTSNAYRALLPDSIVKYLPRWMRPAPLPDDALQFVAERAAELAAMREQLSCREHAESLVGGALGKVLAKLGAAIDRQERESQKHTQPLSESSLNDVKCVGLVGQQVIA